VGLYFGVGLRPAPHARSLATPLDARIPFWPSAIWVYATVYPAILAPVLIVRSPARFRRIAWSLIAVIVICAVCFAFFPVETVSLRQSASVGADSGLDRSFTAWGIRLLFALDPPRNAFPSLHVALATVIALGVGGSLPLGGRAASQRARWTAFAWLAAVVASVVLVRQHYAADAVAGLALGAVMYLFGVGGDGEPDAPGAFEKRGAVGLALGVLAFYAMLHAVFLSFGGAVPE
jgi:membrane-associated phospholipid phosphatase